MDNAVFETPRLIARAWDTDRDAEQAFGMYGDPEVLRFIGTPTPDLATQREFIRAMIERYRQWQGRYGSWPMFDKVSGRSGCRAAKTAARLGDGRFHGAHRDRLAPCEALRGSRVCHRNAPVCSRQRTSGVRAWFRPCPAQKRPMTNTRKRPAATASCGVPATVLETTPSSITPASSHCRRDPEASVYFA
jgi:hypothetical protein